MGQGIFKIGNCSANNTMVKSAYQLILLKCLGAKKLMNYDFSIQVFQFVKGKVYKKQKAGFSDNKIEKKT